MIIGKAAHLAVVILEVARLLVEEVQEVFSQRQQDETHQAYTDLSG